MEGKRPIGALGGALGAGVIVLALGAAWATPTDADSATSASSGSWGGATGGLGQDMTVRLAATSAPVRSGGSVTAKAGTDSVAPAPPVTSKGVVPQLFALDGKPFPTAERPAPVVLQMNNEGYVSAPLTGNVIDFFGTSIEGIGYTLQGSSCVLFTDIYGQTFRTYRGVTLEAGSLLPVDVDVTCPGKAWVSISTSQPVHVVRTYTGVIVKAAPRQARTRLVLNAPARRSRPGVALVTGYGKPGTRVDVWSQSLGEVAFWVREASARVDSKGRWSARVEVIGSSRLLATHVLERSNTAVLWVVTPDRPGKGRRAS